MGGVYVEFLGEIGVDFEEFDVVGIGDVGGFGGLFFEGEEEGLELFEGVGVFVDLDEFDMVEMGGGVGVVV